MKVLWVGDANVSTGFARCTHAVADELHRQGHDVHVLGINYFGDPHDHPYPIYPCLNITDGGKDLFGEQRLPRFIKRLEPDVIVLLNDPWNIPGYLGHIAYELGGPGTDFETLNLPPIVGWLAVDAKNQPAKHLNNLAHVVTWTEFGLEELRLGGYHGEGSVIPLGVDTELFRKCDKAEARSRVVPEMVPDDAFIVGVVGRNQPRKRLDLSLAYFAEWVQTRGIDNAWIYLHVAPTGDAGCNLESVAAYLKISHRMIKATPVVGVGAPEALMPWLYSAFDAYMTTTSGEGFGLPTLEAMACEVPCIVPDFSGLGDWVGDAALKVPCEDTQLNAPMNSQAHTIGAIPAKNQVMQALGLLYDNEDARGRYAAQGRALAKAMPWDKCAVGMVDVLKSVAGVETRTVLPVDSRFGSG